jgi:hypothetical protein
VSITDGNHLPPITDLYRQTFNGVDNFDTYLGHIKWPATREKMELRLLIGYLQMLVINTYSFWIDLNWEKDEGLRNLSITKFIGDLAKELEPK